MYKRETNEERKIKNLESQVSYLQNKLEKIENMLGFNHSGSGSIKGRLELLEAYSIVNDHNEFNSLFGRENIESGDNLFRSYLILKLIKMYEIVALPPHVRRISNEGEHVYNFDKFPPYDKIEKIFHQAMLLFTSPSMTVELQKEVLTMIFNLRESHIVVPEITSWYIKTNEEKWNFVKNNFNSIIKKLKESD